MELLAVLTDEEIHTLASGGVVTRLITGGNQIRIMSRTRFVLENCSPRNEERNENTCVCCGYPIPEGRHVCNTCALNGIDVDNRRANESYIDEPR